MAAPAAVSSADVVIVGAGFGGVAAAIELRRHGIRDVVILEAGEGVGGTWMWNTYPGIACDVPSHLYSYSFAQRRDWTRLCSPGPEILDYLRAVADEHGITGLVRSGREVAGCDFDDSTCRWTVSTACGERYDAGALIVATGQLNRPRTPQIQGADRFSGATFHSARWDHDIDLRGADVAVIGTGASAVQFVPEIAKLAHSVTVYQRTGNWFLPRRNRPYPRWARALTARVPGLQALRRRWVYLYTETLTQAIRRPRTLGRLLALLSSAFMRRQLRGHPELAERLWPHYTFGCKRVLFSSFWLPTLAAPHVELVTAPITEITADGVADATGTLRRADVIIYGTGFATSEFMFPMQINGRGGRSLADAWAGGAHAYLGMAVPGFPSLFVMYGPNTNTSGGSILVFLEAQARYIRQAIELQRSSGAAVVEVREEVERAADMHTQSRFAGTAWLDCDSWYRDEGGRIVTNWPDSMRRYEAVTGTLDPSDFELLAAERRPVTAGA